MEHYLQILKGILIDSPTFIIIFWNWFISAVPQILLVLALIYAVMNILYLRWKWKKERQGIKVDYPPHNK